MIVVILGGVASAIFGYVLRMQSGTTAWLASAVVGFLINALVINLLVKPPSGLQMGLGRACLVSLIEYVIWAVIFLVLFFVFGASLLSGSATL